MDLNGRVDRLLRRLGGEELGHRRELGDRLEPAVVGGGGLEDEQPRGLDPGGDVGEPVGDRLEPGSGAPKASRCAAWATARSSAARAMPTAKAPTLGRKRSRVAIATEKPRSTSPITAEPGTTTPSKRSRPIACGAISRPTRRRARGVARDHEGGQAAGAVVGGPGEDGVDVGLGGVGDPGLLAGQHEPVAVRLGAQRQGGDVRAGARLGERERRHRLAGREPRPPLVAKREPAEPLDRERRLGLGAVPRQPLPHQAELDGAGAIGVPSNSRAEEAVLGHRPQQRAVHAARLAGRGHRREHVARQHRRVLEQRELLVGEVRVERVTTGGRRRPSARLARPRKGTFKQQTGRERPDAGSNGESAYFVWLNRGKESLVLDLARDDDKAVLAAMLARADVFVQNLKPGATAKLGFPLDQLRRAHPRLICCSICGYGESGH